VSTIETDKYTAFAGEDKQLQVKILFCIEIEEAAAIENGDLYGKYANSFIWLWK
jgi:hypothetical protein